MSAQIRIGLNRSRFRAARVGVISWARSFAGESTFVHGHARFILYLVANIWNLEAFSAFLGVLEYYRGLQYKRSISDCRKC